MLLGGSNDMTRNNSVEGMNHILDFMRISDHANVILMSVSHRHDLIRNSCVNNAVEAFNRLKRCENVEMINMGIERNFCMKHGQHLNIRGKEKCR